MLAAFLLLTVVLRGGIGNEAARGDGRSPAPEVAGLRSRVLLRAGFGGAQEEFGFAGIGTGHKRERPVPCYTVTDDRLFLFDWYKAHVKVYDRGGAFVKALGGDYREGNVTLEVRPIDMAVRGNEVYLLVRFEVEPRVPPVAWSRFQVFVLDLDTGSYTDRILFPNDDLGCRDVEIGGRVFRKVYMDGVRFSDVGPDVRVFDFEAQRSFPIVVGSNVLSSERMAHGDVGMHAGQYAIRHVKEGEGRLRIETVDATGRVVGSIPEPGLVESIAPDGSLLAIQYVVVAASEYMYGIHVFDIQGNLVARSSPGKAQHVEPFAPPHVRFRLTNDATVHELVVNKKGVQVWAWSER